MPTNYVQNIFSRSYVFVCDNATDLYRSKSLDNEVQYLRILQSIIRPHHTLLDGGACLGTVSVLMAPFCKEIVAVEADSEIMVKLQRNLQANNITNVQCEEMVLSNHVGELAFFTKSGDKPYSPSTIPVKNYQPISRSSVTLETLSKRYNEFSIVKLDIEGEEINTLQSLCWKPEYLFIEFHPLFLAKHNQTIEDGTKLLTESYTIFYQNKRKEQVLTAWRRK